MQDGLTVNDIVTNHAAAQTEANKGEENKGGENSSNENKSTEQGKEQGGQQEGAAAEQGKQSGAGSDAGKETTTASKKEETQEGKKEETPDPLKNLLKELQVDSVDALKEKLNKANEKPETPEEKEKREALYSADLQRFAVEQGLMKLEDFTARQNLLNTPDKDLVFKKFSEEVRDEITDEVKAVNPDFKEQDIADAIKDAFEKEYPLASSNEKAKARAENKIKREASQLRQPVESSFEIAKSKYDVRVKETAEEAQIRKEFPVYAKTIEDAVSKSVPDKYEVFKDKDGDSEINISIDIPKEDKKKIVDSVVKELSDDAATYYDVFKKKGEEGIKELAKSRIEAAVAKQYEQEGRKKIAEEFLKIGTKRGSDVGAKNSFAVNQGKGQAAEGRTAVDKTTEVIDSMKRAGPSK